jgi:flagellar biosynthesis protein FliP
MRRNSTSAMGALHPVLFFLVIYGISLFLAIFVCRTVYYSINDEGTTSSKTVQTDVYSTQVHTTALK